MRTRTTSTIARILTGSLVAWLAIAGPAAAARPVAGTASGHERAEHARIVAYWTAERMANAIPADPGVFSGGRDLTAKGAAGTTGCGTSSGTDWTCGGAAQESVGKVFFTKGGSNYSCSGSVITGGGSGASLVITAGHCVWDFNNGVFDTNWVFVPAYDEFPAARGDCGATKYGCWTAASLYVHDNFAKESGFTSVSMRNDWGFAKVLLGGKNNEDLDQVVASFAPGWASGPSSGTQNVYVFGFPAAKKYTGKALIYCAGTLSTDPKKNNETWQLPSCGLTAGSSGGPWFSPFDTGTGSGSIFSVYSYYYSGVNSVFGSKFGQLTTDTYNAAVSGSTNTRVGGSGGGSKGGKP